MGQENGIPMLKLIVGLNVEDTLMLCVDLQNLQVSQIISSPFQ